MIVRCDSGAFLSGLRQTVLGGRLATYLLYNMLEDQARRVPGAMVMQAVAPSSFESNRLGFPTDDVLRK